VVRVLLTGATGFIGRALAPALVGAGHDVVAGTRQPESYEGPGRPVKLDLVAPDSLAEALDGCEAAWYLVHSMESGVGDFAAQDRAGAAAFARAASERGVRVVYLGGLGDDRHAGAAGAGTRPGSTSPHLDSRHEVGRILREGADTVELRAAMVIGAGSASFEILRQLVDRLPVMVCPRWVTTRCQPIALADVVRYLVAAPRLPAGSYDVGGADILTYEKMMQRYAALTRRRRLIFKVPVLSPGLSSHWIGLVTDQSAAVARPLADGLSVEVVVVDNRIRSLVPFAPMGFDDSVMAALGR
jgi:uncharacterized protein YbjT (DUF2867 family)